MDKIQKKFLNDRGFLKDTVFSDGRYEALKEKLLERGGDAVILTVNLDSIYKQLLNEGQFYNRVEQAIEPYDNAFEAVKHMPDDIQIQVGFQLDADNLWRFSTWGVDAVGTVSEGTALKGSLYYGIPDA